jgi:hypothetical protein
VATYPRLRIETTAEGNFVVLEFGSQDERRLRSVAPYAGIDGAKNLAEEIADEFGIDFEDGE